MKENDFKVKLEECLEVERELSLDENFKELEEWDSLAVLTVLAMINEEYDVTISRDMLEKVNTVKELWGVIQEIK